MNEFVGDLATGTAAAHDEHCTLRQLLRASVASRICLQHSCRNLPRDLRNPRPLKWAGRKHHVLRVNGTVRHRHNEPAITVVLGQIDDFGVRPHAARECAPRTPR